MESIEHNEDGAQHNPISLSSDPAPPPSHEASPLSSVSTSTATASSTHTNTQSTIQKTAIETAFAKARYEKLEAAEIEALTSDYGAMDAFFDEVDETIGKLRQGIKDVYGEDAVPDKESEHSDGRLDDDALEELEREIAVLRAEMVENPQLDTFEDTPSPLHIARSSKM